MEINLKEPIHIEFYGIPGCGKSNISHMVAGQLRAQGIKIYEPSYDSDHNLRPIIRKLYKLFTTFFFYFSNHKEYKMLQRLAEENGCLDFKAYFKQIVNIVPKIKYYHKSESYIYLWDEGLVQSAISLAWNSNIDVGKNEKFLFAVAKQRKTIKVHLKTDIETALRRMAERNSNDSRVEKELDERKKQAMMARFEECCNQISGDTVQIECLNLSAEMLSHNITNKLIELM